MIETFNAHPSFRGFRVDTGHLRAELIELGGIVTRLEVPDRNGVFGNVLLGCPTIADYLGPHPHFNCLVGRYANRITNACFTLDGKAYALDANIPPHHLHGGRRGFGVRVWEGSAQDDAVTFRLVSPDGEGGYPGRLEVEARYRFDAARVVLEITASTDASTPVSLTSHHYYNLAGNLAGHSSGVVGTVRDHAIAIDAGAFLPISEHLTQLGEIRPVDGTPFDLRREVVLEDAMAAADAQMRLANGGFDHTFVLPFAPHGGERLRHAATARHPASGRTLTVSTDQPGIHLYTGNTLHESAHYPQYGGLCFETQQFPDAPNHPSYPNAIVRPGEVFRACTEFAFSLS